MNIFTLIVAFCSAISSIAAVIVSALALIRTKQIAKTNLFVELRKSHAEVHAQMDPRYHDASWDLRTEPAALRTLERYWLQTFTEWYATTLLNKGAFADVWDEFLARAVAGGMRNRPLLIALWGMMYGQPGSSFSGFRKEFGDAIESIYKKHHHKELRDSI